MEIQFHNSAGTVLFVRSDMEQGNWTHEEYSVNMTFPYDKEKVIQRGQIISFKDSAGSMQFFEVRNVTNNEPDHYQQIIGEHIVVSELSDEHQNTLEITESTPDDALDEILSGTLWETGNCTVTDRQSVDISRGSVWQAVNSIAQNWNAYITPRVTIDGVGNITGRYLDITPAQGTWRGLVLSIDKNMSDSSVVYDDSEVYTALYGYGGNVDVPQQTGDDSQQELTFADVVWSATSDHPAKPSGQTYLEDPAKTALYGRNGRPRFGYYQNGNITDAEILLEKTWETLKNVSEPKISISGTVSDLARLGYIDTPLGWHDTAIVYIRQTGEKFEKGIIRYNEDLIDPTASRVEIGDYIPNIIYINRDTNEKASGGGGGGGHGEDPLEYEQVKTYTGLEQSNEMIGLVVGLRNGDAYIKAGEIAIAINASTGETEAKIDATKIFLNGTTTIQELLSGAAQIEILDVADLYAEQGVFDEINTDVFKFDGETAEWKTITINGTTYKLLGAQ